MDKKRRALLALLGCALLWSTGGYLIKSAGLPPMAISGGRSLFAVLFFLVVFGRPRWNPRPVFIGAILAYAGTLTAFTAATSLTTAANAILLQYASPIFVCLFEWLFYREKPTRFDIIVIALVLGGLVLFFLDNLDSMSFSRTGAALLGNFLGLLSGVFFALLAVLIRRVRQREQSPESVLIWGNLLCVIVALPFMFSRLPSPGGLLCLVILGVVQIGVAYLLYNYALSEVTSLELILVPVIEPLLNPLWVFLLLGEVPGPHALAGGAIVLFVITFWCLRRDRQRRRTAIQTDRS